MTVVLDEFHQDFKKHQKQDDRRFSKIDQKLAVASGKLNVIIVLLVSSGILAWLHG